MKFLTQSRFIFFSIFIICAFSLGFAFYFEYVKHMEPCVLCWIQRIFFGLTGITCLIAAIQNPKAVGRRIYAFLGLIFSALGLLAACRQIWIKFNPANTGCLPTTFTSIFEDNPFFEAIITAFKGTPECGIYQGDFLWIELPYWGVLFFALFSLVLLFQLVRKN